MSAPEPQVRVEPGRWRCDCGQFGGIGHGQTQSDIERGAVKHKAECRLIRLQARWDARDTALRALVAEWRERTVTVMPSTLTAADTERLTWAAAADDLERAIGGTGC